MKLLLVFAIVFVVAHAASIEEQWQEFKMKHGKTYKSLLEEKKRFAIFQDRIRQFEEHNARFAKGEVRYSMGINQFTDMTKDELERYVLPKKPLPPRKIVGFYNDTSVRLGDEIINWVDKGAVTSVKHQQQCGSCWAFSTVGVIEGQVAIHEGTLESLSPQFLVDCVNDDGCNGEWPVVAYQYVEEYGIPSEADYPYQGVVGRCTDGRRSHKLSGYVELDLNEDTLLSALSKKGPISILIDATKIYNYDGGIMDKSSDCLSVGNHAVLAVGAGSEDGTDYWLIKNSWGTDWGEDGYIRLIRGEDACGINTANSYPKL